MTELPTATATELLLRECVWLAKLELRRWESHLEEYLRERFMMEHGADEPDNAEIPNDPN